MGHPGALVTALYCAMNLDSFHDPCGVRKSKDHGTLGKRVLGTGVFLAIHTEYTYNSSFIC